jgi:ARG/rhodanese/phosphatase superfamily protein
VSRWEGDVRCALRAHREWQGEISMAQGPQGQTRIEGDEAVAVATAVKERVRGVRMGEPLRAGALTLVPLLPGGDAVDADGGEYLPLERALREGLFQVTEQQQASVPELLATSTAPAPVILIGGEQVVGGLQNRVLNTTMLVAAGTTLRVPVTCVEQGRWSPARHAAMPGRAVMDADDMTMGDAAARERQRRFTSDEAAYASLRRVHAKKVSESLSSGLGHRSDQGAVWGEVSARMARTSSHSPTYAMDALYKEPERAARLAEMTAALPRPAGAMGFVAVVGGEPVGAELFAGETLAGAYWEKLARSYALEALDAERQGAVRGTFAGTEQQRLLDEALAAEIAVYASPGLGRDARLAGAKIAGAGLVHEGRVVHLSLFADEADAAGQPVEEQAEVEYSQSREASAQAQNVSPVARVRRGPRVGA